MRIFAATAMMAVLGVSGCGAGGESLFEAFPAPLNQQEADILRDARPPEAAPSGIVYSLPRVLMNVTMRRIVPPGGVGAAPTFEMTADTGRVSPDPTYTFTLSYEHDSLSSDEVTVKTTNDGLLTLVSTTTQDQSFGVVTGVISLATEIAKGVATGPLGAAVGAAPRVQTLDRPRARPFEVSMLIDPTWPDLTQRVTERLRAFGVSGVTLRAVAIEPPGEQRTLEELRAFCSAGPCYRRTAPITIEAIDAATGTGVTLTTELPNNGVIGRLDFVRRSYVKNQATAIFDRGMLTEVTYVDPSEANEIANAPVEAARAIFSIPSAIWQSQTDELEQQEKLLEARASLLKERAALIEAEERLRKAQQEAADNQ